VRGQWPNDLRFPDLVIHGARRASLLVRPSITAPTLNLCTWKFAQNPCNTTGATPDHPSLCAANAAGDRDRSMTTTTAAAATAPQRIISQPNDQPVNYDWPAMMMSADAECRGISTRNKIFLPLPQKRSCASVRTPLEPVASLRAGTGAAEVIIDHHDLPGGPTQRQCQLQQPILPLGGDVIHHLPQGGLAYR